MTALVTARDRHHLGDPPLSSADLAYPLGPMSVPAYVTLLRVRRAAWILENLDVPVAQRPMLAWFVVTGEMAYPTSTDRTAAPYPPLSRRANVLRAELALLLEARADHNRQQLGARFTRIDGRIADILAVLGFARQLTTLAVG